MSKRIEQPRRHGHYDPRYLVVERHDLKAALDMSPRANRISPARLGLLPPTPPGDKERVEL